MLSRKNCGTNGNKSHSKESDIINTLVKVKKFTWKTIAERRHIIKTRSKCNCCCCLDSGIRYDYEILQEEIKSTQKSIARCKEDTNKILYKVQRLEAYFQ